MGTQLADCFSAIKRICEPCTTKIWVPGCSALAWALATVTAWFPARGSRRLDEETASPTRIHRRRGPGGSDAIYAGLRARCEELRAAEAAQLTDLADLRHAWVVLFRGDETGDGIHSLSSEGREIVLAFEAGAEAQRFALVLKAQGFYEPTPRRMDVRDLEAFCASGRTYLATARARGHGAGAAGR